MHRDEDRPDDAAEQMQFEPAAKAADALSSHALPRHVKKGHQHQCGRQSSRGFWADCARRPEQAMPVRVGARLKRRAVVFPSTEWAKHHETAAADTIRLHTTPLVNHALTCRVRPLLAVPPETARPAHRVASELHRAVGARRGDARKDVALREFPGVKGGGLTVDVTFSDTHRQVPHTPARHNDGNVDAGVLGGFQNRLPPPTRRWRHWANTAWRTPPHWVVSCRATGTLASEPVDESTRRPQPRRLQSGL